MSDLVTISSSVLPRGVQVLGFRGTETISRPYEIEIFLIVRQEIGEELDLADAIGGKARLVVDRHELGVPPFIFAGVFGRVEVLHAFDNHVVVRAVLVPRLWQLALGRHSRIFTKMKVPDIIKAVLEENGVTDYELRLGTYEVEEHVCQYRESDLDFISRWMEREGIFYFFEHGDDGERLILTDHRAYDDDELGVPVRYFPQAGGDAAKGTRFRSFTCRHTTLPASVRLKDYDYAKPNLNVSGTAKVADNGTGEVHLYGERFFSPSAGDRLAKIRAEEMLARQAVYHAAGNRTHLRAGYTFEVDEHPFPSFNTKYLAYAVHHIANQANGHHAVRGLLQIEGGDEIYAVEVDAMPAKLQFRAESLTAWPRIYGYENGIVDGPADSEYAQIDEQGRYNAKFKFDESTLKNGKATTWVRMMQPHGGDIEGFHFPLRKGTEVVFSYLGGDPDRPVISGVVPNAINPSPITSVNHTRNVIQTGARNRLELEDKAGTEWIHLSTPYSDSFLHLGSPNSGHEIVLNTTKNTLFEYGNNFDVNVGAKGGGHWFTEVLGGDTTLHIPDGDYRIGVSDGIGVAADDGITILINGGCAVPGDGGDGGFKMDVLSDGVEVTAQEEISITSKAANIEMKAMAADIKMECAANHELKIGGTTFELKTADANEIMLGNEMTFTANASLEVKVGDKTELFLGEAFEMNVGLNQDIFLGDKMELTVGATQELQVGDALEMFVGNKTELAISASEALTIGPKTEITIGPQIEMTDAIKISLEMGLALELNLALTLKNKAAEIEMKEFNMEIKDADVEEHPVHARTGGPTINMMAVIIFA